MVPVHYYDINVCPGQQQLCEVIHPRWWRSRGPITMNDECCRFGQVKMGVGGQVGVGHERATGAILPGVQQQPDSDAGSNDGVTEI